jgi:2-haloacid dehalogenase
MPKQNARDTANTLGMQRSTKLTGRDTTLALGKVSLEAIVFDTFGTLVDWRTSLIDAFTAYGATNGLDVDWPSFVDAWRHAYVPAMDRVRRGEHAWATLDELHAESFDELATTFGFRKRIDDNARTWFVNGWHRLHPWPDTVPGLTRLRARWITGTLSNGNVRLLTDLARFASLPMDVILSAELFRHYKRDPEVYRGAVELLGTTPSRVMLVAAHNDDLLAAQAQGLRTAFIARPTEYGPTQTKDLVADPRVDFSARSIEELADQLGA